LIGKCLKPIPADRYPTAAALAADLRRYLGDLPLLGVSNRSWSERWRKWRRRRPHALTLYVLSFAFLVAAAAAGLSAFIQIRNRYVESQQNLITGQELLAKGDWDGSIRTFSHGLHLSEALPFSGDLQKELETHLRLAREKKAASDFHLVADQIRLRSVADSLTDHDLRDLESSCRAAWNSLHLITLRLGELEEEDRLIIRRDFFDMAVVGANLRVRLASKDDVQQAREAALQVLDEAEATFGPSPVLQSERKILADTLGVPEKSDHPSGQAATLPPPKSWEYCSLGRSLLQSGKLEAASKEFKEAIRLEPGGLWPNYYAGVCAFRLGRPKDALQPFSVCVGAASKEASKTVQAQIFYDRALAHSGTGADREALDDYNRALLFDPNMGKAALNRGLLHFKQATHDVIGKAAAHEVSGRNQKYQQALDDLNLALDNGVPPAVVHYNQALIYQAQNNREAALASARQALEYEPHHKDAQALLKQLMQKQ